MEEKVNINAEIDLAGLKASVDEALKLEDNGELFGQLAAIAKTKKQVADVMEQVEQIERDAKGLINAKAKALYGPNWQAIKGPGYKISRSMTGSKYEHAAGAPEQFIIVKTSVDSKAVDKYVTETNELPTGIAYNPSRGESIRITVTEQAE